VTETMHPDDMPPVAPGGGAAAGLYAAAEKDRSIRCQVPNCAHPLGWHPTEDQAAEDAEAKCEHRRCSCARTQEQIRGGSGA
jgi:hypothetical protein